MRIGPLIIGLAACGCLASCVQALGHGEVDWGHGARRATVLATLGPQVAEAEARTCVPDGWDWQADRRYVRVRYRGVRLHRETVATVAEGLALQPGDEVELWPQDCRAGRLARVERLLSSPTLERRERQ